MGIHYRRSQPGLRSRRGVPRGIPYRRGIRPMTFEIGQEGQPTQEYDPVAAAYDFPDPAYEVPIPRFDEMAEAATTPPIRFEPAQFVPEEPTPEPGYLPLTEELMERAMADALEASMADEQASPASIEDLAEPESATVEAAPPDLGMVDTIEAGIEQVFEAPAEMPDAQMAAEPPGLEAIVQAELAGQFMEDLWAQQQMYEDEMMQMMDPYGMPGFGPGPGFGPMPGP